MQAENGHPGTVAEVEANKPKPQASSANAPMSNQTLFVENLPKEANEGMLLLVFQKFPGLKEVRLVPHKPGIAFVEYDNEQGASAAMVGLQGFKLATDKPMAISFAKR
jgi:RNA recognition motif-containing protein